MHEARERFLRAIAERIPAERIAELHLFPPLRQGGRETGIAVVAVYPDAVFVQGELPLAPSESAAAGAGDTAATGESPAAEAATSELAAEEPPPSEAAESPVESSAESRAGTGTTADAESAEAESSEASAEASVEASPDASVEASAGEPATESAGAPPRHHDDADTLAEPHPEDAGTIESAPDEPPGGEDVTAATAGADRSVAAGIRRPPRLTVFRAVYRWTLKGVDRGKWEVDVIAEADAPLVAIEDVVRGVHRRAGGEAEPERLTGDAVRAALSEQPWTATT
ncbi:MAG TPA: hypothetical protein VFS05_00135 [Gemmatimonadaceae bacterium]|nr:hypothetical protein [Gemmatimonadaceae bacterium]